MTRPILLCLLFVCVSILNGTDPRFIVSDKEWDDGSALDLSWDLPTDVGLVTIMQEDESGSSLLVYSTVDKQGSYTHTDLEYDKSYSFYLVGYFPDSEDSLLIRKSGVPTQQWFYLHKLPLLIMLLLISAAILLYIRAARRGKEFYIRRINGLDSMEEAIGRATEKGKPILFVPGIGDLDDIQTIASLTILSQLAYSAAEYNTDVIVPCRFSMVLSAAKEVVKEAYLKAGKPDAFKESNIFYLTDDQFGYVAGIDGIMLREEPAANFFLGTFYAESLILAETGFSTGAIQTSGTANAHQLPFFVVSCDYTLIGEELFAASAYLSKDPQQLGSLKGHDFGKVIVIGLIISGVALEMMGIGILRNFISGVF